MKKNISNIVINYNKQLLNFTYLLYLFVLIINEILYAYCYYLIHLIYFYSFIQHFVIFFKALFDK
jgi:hypothetical protein